MRIKLLAFCLLALSCTHTRNKNVPKADSTGESTGEMRWTNRGTKEQWVLFTTEMTFNDIVAKCKNQRLLMPAQGMLSDELRDGEGLKNAMTELAKTDSHAWDRQIWLPGAPDEDGKVDALVIAKPELPLKLDVDDLALGACVGDVP